MSEKLFREKSLNKIKSPENLNDYIRVTDPAMWLLLVSVIALLVGVCIWGVYGRIDSVLPVDVYVVGGQASCHVDEADIKDLQVGSRVKMNTTEGSITAIGSLRDRSYSCSLQLDSMPPDGVYTGKLVVQSIQPLSFILN